jgi:phenylalanyl-tRNA synthetase alpha chain
MLPDKIALSLSNNERVVLNAISKESHLSEIVKNSKVPEIVVKRSLQFLGNKELVEVDSVKSKFIMLGKNGEKYKKKGLPEVQFLMAVKDSHKKMSEMPLEKDEVNVCLGLLKKKGAIGIKKDGELIISITEFGKTLLKKESLEGKFLEGFDKELDLEKLSPEEKFAYDILIKRKDILVLEERTHVKAKVTKLGEDVKKVKSEEVIEKVTSKLIKNQEWKNKKFKYYDIKSKTPDLYGGKKHPLSQAIEYIKSIWLELGFTEMSGNFVQTSFWNFDALFTAQDHPVRELQDTFYLKNSNGKLPDKEIVERIKKAHENGWTTGSKGWQYDWSEIEAKKNVMRTHTTALSVNQLFKLKKDQIPGKFFSVGKCFRNETIDWSHSFEFYQVEGIVVGESVTFRQLLGYLKQYYKKLGFDKVRFRPAYFPYTEMSVEAEVFHPKKKTWMELGGAGIFRPEVVKPILGKDIPVLAWGQGLERGVMEHLQIKNLKELYANDLDLLKKSKMW